MDNFALSLVYNVFCFQINIFKLAFKFIYINSKFYLHLIFFSFLK